MNSALTTRRGLFVIALIAIGVSLTLVARDETKGPKWLLQLKLQPKDAFIIYISGENEIRIENISGNFGGPFEATYRWDVLSVDPNGNIEIKVSVKSADYPGLMLPLGPAFENSTFTLRMAADGEILGFDGTDKMRAEVSTGLTFPMIEQNNNTGLSGDNYEKTIEIAKLGALDHIQDEALRGLFEPLFRVWPAIPVATGAKWTLERVPTYLPIPNTGAFATTEFEVTSWEEGEVTLATHADIQTIDTDEENKLSGSAHGTIVLDEIGGFLKSASLTREVESTVTLPIDENKPGPAVRAITLREDVIVEIRRLVGSRKQDGHYGR